MFLVSVLDRATRSLLDQVAPLPGLVHQEIDGSTRVLDLSGQATKGAWGMSWHQKAMKGVEVCEKPGGADKQALIPGYPN